MFSFGKIKIREGLYCQNHVDKIFENMTEIVAEAVNPDYFFHLYTDDSVVQAGLKQLCNSTVQAPKRLSQHPRAPMGLIVPPCRHSVYSLTGSSP